MALNSNMHKAKRVKNDEFFTQLSDIENELRHYKDHFKDKVIFLNCDNPKRSEFWQYFNLNFEFLGLKKLITSHYNLETGEGDFRSTEAIELLEEADIIVTNPPFSLFREFIAQLIEYDKKFLIIGNMNAMTFKEIFPLMRDNKLWLGYNCVRHFKKPDGTMFETARTFWFTNLDHNKRHEDTILYKIYNEENYPKYDNYDAINVNKVKDIPINYDGIIGVPITFMDKYNPDQFEIISCNDVRTNNKTPFKEHGLVKDKDSAINGKAKYARILIRNRKLNEH